MPIAPNSNIPMPSNSIVFVDSRVANYQSFIDNLTEPADVFILDGESHGLTQMADYLKGRTGIDAIHVISHGSQGALYLGSTVLNSLNLASYQTPLTTIGSALTPTGDILLYGCNVAQGNTGLQLITSLAQYTSADVAASGDATGAAALGGDGLLEQVSGSVEAASMLVNHLTELLAVNTAPIFGFSTGKVMTNFVGTYDQGKSATLQSDGKILVAGHATSSSGSFDFALARYNANGSLDTSFDGDGKLTTDFFGLGDGANSITLQSDGKIVVAGTAHISSGISDFALARYNANGSLDTSFDGDGKLTTDFLGSYAECSSVTLQGDGKIVAAGNARNSSTGVFALARYNADGGLDPSFGDVGGRLDGNPTYTGSSPVVLDADVQIFDAELGQANNYSGTTLTLTGHSGANVNDVFSAKTFGTLSALSSGSFFSVAGVTVGLVVSNSNGTLKLGFNSNATQALVSQAMQQITYSNTASIPAALAQIDWTFNDGNTGSQGTAGALVATGSTVVNITARNIAPVVSHALTDISILPNAPLNLVLPIDAFFDANTGDPLTFSISMNNGTALPTWMTFNPANRTLSGNPGTLGIYDLSEFDIKVTVTDIAGSSVSDVFRLTVTNGTLTGNNSNEVFAGGTGSYTIDGSGGTDTVIFNGNLANYTISKSGSTYTVRTNTSTNSTDTLQNIECLKFSDKTINLTVQAKAAAAPQADVTRLAELYVAFFNRVPDADGLSYWIDQMGAGQSITQIADSFYSAGVQYASLTGFSTGMTDADFVKVIYKNVLGRTGTTAPPDADVNYWVNNLTSGADTRGSLINTILGSAHSFKGDTTWGWVPNLLDNKIAVAKSFAIDWGLNYNTANDSISQGMAIAAAVTPTDTSAAIALIGVTGSDLQLG